MNRRFFRYLGALSFVALPLAVGLAQGPPTDPPSDPPRTPPAPFPSVASPPGESLPKPSTKKRLDASSGKELKRAKNLIRNGNFETPDIAPEWTTIYAGEGKPEFAWIVGASPDAREGSARVDIKDTYILGISETGVPKAGDQCLNLDYLVVMHQDVATEPGKRYRIYFRYAQNPDGFGEYPRARFRVIGKVDHLNEEVIHKTPCTFKEMHYDTYDKTFVADSVNTRVEFADLSNNATGLILDDVRLTEASDSADDVIGGKPTDDTTADDATARGKYSHLLRTILAPEDEASYGAFRDYGPYTGSSYKSQTDLPAGYWVYAKPYWYIWKNAREGGRPISSASKNPIGKRVTVKLVNGSAIAGYLVEETATTLLLDTNSANHLARIERSQVVFVSWDGNEGSAADVSDERRGGKGGGQDIHRAPVAPIPAPADPAVDDSSAPAPSPPSATRRGRPETTVPSRRRGIGVNNPVGTGARDVATRANWGMPRGNLIRNGGFETPDVESPWRHVDAEDSGGEFVWRVGKGAKGSGYIEIKDTIWHGVSEGLYPSKPDQSVDIDYEGTLSQEFKTEAGAKYELRFAYSHNPDIGNGSSSGTVRVIDVVDGATLFEKTLVHAEKSSYEDMMFIYYVESFTAKGAATRLEFESHQTHTRGFVIDAVSVIAIP
jgi:hypothetical protein